MEKTERMPMWVFLAFSSINRRKWAVWAVWSCVIFTIYCIPWPLFFENQDFLKTLCPIENWIWFWVMVVMTIWYWFSLRWMDRNGGWEKVRRV